MRRALIQPAQPKSSDIAFFVTTKRVLSIRARCLPEETRRKFVAARSGSCRARVQRQTRAAQQPRGSGKTRAAAQAPPPHQTRY
jgi:hypothetical protein